MNIIINKQASKMMNHVISVIGIQPDILRIDDTTVLVKAGLFQLFSYFFYILLHTRLI